MIFILILIVCSLLLSALFSSSETALTGANVFQLQEQAKENKKLLHTIWLLNNKEKSIGVILLGNTLSNVILASLSGSLGYILAGESGVAYSTIIVTIVVFLFGEILPKLYSIRNADRVLIRLSYVLHILVIILNPIVFTLHNFAKFVLKSFKKETKYNERIQIDTIYGMINTYATNKKRQELSWMMSAIMMLEDTTVHEIMTHRADVFTLSTDLEPDVLLERALKCPYSRIPLIDEENNILGILHVRELAVKAQNQGIDNITWKHLLDSAISPWSIHEDTNVITQLRSFREIKRHMAIVVDDQKIFQGIITLEDVLEEITGNIEDEFDIQNQPLKIADSTFRFNANLSIKESNRRFGTHFDMTKEYSTISGLLLYASHNIPQENQTYNINDHTLHILRASNRRILRVELKI